MPLLRVTHQRGAFTDAQKAQLAEELSHAILMGEVGSDNPAARALLHVIFDEIDPKTSWFYAGKLQETAPVGGYFIFDVVYSYGASSQELKTQLHKDINDVVSRVLGVDGTFPNRGTDWVLIHEMPEGNWGAGGITVGAKDIHTALQGDPARRPFLDASLEANTKMLKAHGFPTGAAGMGK